MPASSFDNFISGINRTLATTQAPNSATSTQIDTIPEKIADAKRIHKSNPDNIYGIKAVTWSLLQLGAASPKLDPNHTFTIGYISFDNKTLKKAINDTDSSLTPRKLAKAIRDDISVVSQ